MRPRARIVRLTARKVYVGSKGTESCQSIVDGAAGTQCEPPTFPGTPDRSSNGFGWSRCSPAGRQRSHLRNGVPQGRCRVRSLARAWTTPARTPTSSPRLAATTRSIPHRPTRSRVRSSGVRGPRLRGHRKPSRSLALRLASEGPTRQARPQRTRSSSQLRSEERAARQIVAEGSGDALAEVLLEMGEFVVDGEDDEVVGHRGDRSPVQLLESSSGAVQGRA